MTNTTTTNIIVGGNSSDMTLTAAIYLLQLHHRQLV
jgi:hypothetical protein